MTKKKVAPPDRLVEIFRRQAELEEKYGPIERDNGFHVPEMPIDIDDPHDQMFFRDNAHFLTEEIHEATGLLKNKPWKQSFKETDKQAFFEEMADQVHFFVKQWLYIFGPDPEDAAGAFYQWYFGKSEVNRKRQAEGY